MKIVVFGANGRVGQLVVHDALAAGHSVVAFVHGDHAFEEDSRLEVHRGDIHSPEEVDTAINGVDAVISALGSWGTQGKDILTSGMKNIIPSMQKYGVKRIVSLTGSDARMDGEDQGLISCVFRIILMTMAGKILKDGEEHMRLLSASDLDWTIVRSPVMNDRGDPAKYTLVTKKPSLLATINRASVAKALLDLVPTKDFLKQTPHIKRT